MHCSAAADFLQVSSPHTLHRIADYKNRRLIPSVAANLPERKPSGNQKQDSHLRKTKKETKKKQKNLRNVELSSRRVTEVKFVRQKTDSLHCLPTWVSSTNRQYQFE